MTDHQVVSYSEIDTYRQCPLKHQLSYKERWASTEPEAEALGRGTLFHLVMETHYGVLREAQEGTTERFRGLSRPQAAGLAAEIAEEAVLSLLHDSHTGEQTERQALVEWIYEGYLEQWGLDPDWKIVAIERPLEVVLPDEDGNDSGFKLAGTVDLVVRDMSSGGGLWIVDHKTCKNLPNQKDFDMEDQTALYTYLLRAQGEDIRGAIYNHCRTYKLVKREMGLDERFRRTLTVRGDEELRIMALEALDTMQEAYRDRGGRDARRHPDGERCGWKCGYTEACLAARKGKALAPTMERFGFAVQKTKPGPTFQKRAAAESK